MESKLDIAVLDQRREVLNPEGNARALPDRRSWRHLLVNGEAKHVTGYMKDYPVRAGTGAHANPQHVGGEKARLVLARILARPSNLLILDEPTNDLDMETLDLLQEVVASYSGTVILVSHDRDFLDRTVTSETATAPAKIRRRRTGAGSAYAGG